MSENNANEMIGKTQVVSGVKLVVGQTELARMVTDDTVTILYYGNIVTINGEKASTKFPKEKYTEYVNRYIKKQIRLQKKKEESQIKPLVQNKKTETVTALKDEDDRSAKSGFYIETDDEEDEIEEPEEKHEEKVEKMVRRKKNVEPEYDDYDEDELEDDEYEDDSDSEEEEDEEIDEDEEESSERSYKTVFIASLIAAFVFLGTSVFLVLASMQIIPVTLPWENASESATGEEIRIIRLAADVAAGEQIENADIEEVAVTQEKYDELSSGKMLDENGMETSDSVILYSNADDVIGKYASSSLKKGEYITTSDFSDIISGEKTITMDVDGEQVTVPVTVTQTGNSSITIYAICTNTTEDGKVNNTAMKLGEFSLEGRNLMDIKNEDGESVIEQLLKEQTENQKKAEEEAKAKAEEENKEAEASASPEATAEPEASASAESE